MTNLERIYKIDRLIRRPPYPDKRRLLEELSVSPAQFKRDLEFMRSRLHAPVVYDPNANGYRYSDTAYQLPGLWFQPAELGALLALESLFSESQPGPLSKFSQPLRDKVRDLLKEGIPGPFATLAERIHIWNAPVRPCRTEHFETLCGATLQRRKLRIGYFTRSRKANTERVVSPQQIICYRGTWYFDAWCHQSEALRRFALDSVRSMSELEEPALEHFGGSAEGYGIFTGPAEQNAVLVFEEASARWVEAEQWHPRQRITPLETGRVELRVPFSHPQEIMMDILRHGALVEVVSPRSLRNAVAAAHRAAAERYEAQRRAPTLATAAAKVS